MAPGNVPRVRFLSPEWIAALDEAAAGWSAPAELDLTVEQVVRRPGEATAVYHLSFTGGRLRVVAGPAEHADVTLTLDYPVAAGIARGEANAQAALAAGHLQVGGNLQLLSTRARLLTGLDDVFAVVRPATTY